MHCWKTEGREREGETTTKPVRQESEESSKADAATSQKRAASADTNAAEPRGAWCECEMANNVRCLQSMPPGLPVAEDEATGPPILAARR